MKKQNFKISAKQGGFTLIELIVVIVILGIMAATAMPTFVSYSTDARMAKMQAAAGAITAAAAMAYAKTAASTGTGTYPAAADAMTAANLSGYVVSGSDVTPDGTKTGCKITYSATTGAVDTSAVTTANC